MNTDAKAIITKYALTSGPVLTFGHNDPESQTKMLVVSNGVRRDYYHRNDWHLTKREATDDVLKRFIKRMHSLKKSIDKLASKRDKALKAINDMEMP